MSKALFLGFVVGIAVFTIGAVGASQLQDKNSGLNKTNERDYQREIVDATPVQLGNLTTRQQFHGRLFNGVGKHVGGKTITEWIASYRGQRIVLVTSLMGRQFLESAEPPTTEDYFGRLAKDSDAIIRGRVTSKVSHITEDDSFLFTDYDVTVSEVLKDNLSNPISSGSSIAVTWAGGKIVIDDVIMKAGGNGDALLPVGDQDLLLFVKSIPETGAYKLTRGNAAFEIGGTSVRPLAGLLPLPSLISKEKISFLKTIRAVSTK